MDWDWLGSLGEEISEVKVLSEFGTVVIYIIIKWLY